MSTHRMSCNETREKLPLYVGGDLDAEVLDAVRAHLDACSECTGRAAQATHARRELVSALRSRETGPARADLWPSIRTVLRKEGLVHEPRTPVAHPPKALELRRTRWTWALVPATAAAVLLALIQISGILSKGPGSEHLPGPFTPPPIDGGFPGGNEVVVAPVAAPSGGLRRVDPHDPLWLSRPVRYRPLRLNTGESAQPVPNEISLTGLNGFK